MLNLQAIKTHDEKDIGHHIIHNILNKIESI